MLLSSRDGFIIFTIPFGSPSPTTFIEDALNTIQWNRKIQPRRDGTNVPFTHRFDWILRSDVCVCVCVGTACILGVCCCVNGCKIMVAYSSPHPLRLIRTFDPSVHYERPAMMKRPRGDEFHEFYNVSHNISSTRARRGCVRTRLCGGGSDGCGKLKSPSKPGGA